ncbi:GAF and ANTAR domain-containing protein [Streptomyces beigongshangae]|uniref:GAF and ANTAR domain-containing protein n=1 Tax=Streptomyces beigongshangae TaxID=2841597 RepID=UPI001C85FACF|nr:GAF and ANTAR domain-containing protein [Streptomyces sp. REN17]
MDRERLVTETFIELADTLVDDFDVVAFLQQLCTRCAELLDVRSAAVLLALPDEPPHPVAPCDPGAALSRLLTIAQREGPALECHRSGTALNPVDLGDGADRWPVFTAGARRAGYRSASVLPLRLRQQTLGSLLLLRTVAVPVPAADVRLAQALADAAAIGLVNAQTLAEHRTVNAQLRTALHSRVIIEQAKGVLMHRLDASADQAFETMRRYARHHRLRLTAVAQTVIDQDLLPVVPDHQRPSARTNDGQAGRHPGEVPQPGPPVDGTTRSVNGTAQSADGGVRPGGEDAAP